MAAGPVETSIFAVQGVDVDVTSTDAAAAKNQALMDVQVKAFYQLVERLGTPELAAELQQKLKPEDIAPYLRSLSIEKETSAPGRYIGRFTVRFLPQKMQKFFGDYGIRVPTQQADPVLIVPVFRGPDGNKLWEDNPWRKAWIDLKGEQGIVPIIVPLGDLEDTETLSVDDALKGDAIRLEALRKRYGAPSLLVAQAQPTEDGGLHVYHRGRHQARQGDGQQDLQAGGGQHRRGRDGRRRGLPGHAGQDLQGASRRRSPRSAAPTPASRSPCRCPSPARANGTPSAPAS